MRECKATRQARTNDKRLNVRIEWRVAGAGWLDERRWCRAGDWRASGNSASGRKAGVVAWNCDTGMVGADVEYCRPGRIESVARTWRDAEAASERIMSGMNETWRTGDGYGERQVADAMWRRRKTMRREHQWQRLWW